jgi:hypothetical protein
MSVARKYQAASPKLAHTHRGWSGTAQRLCPGTSDVDFLGDLDSVVNLHTEVADGALDLRVAEQQQTALRLPVRR